MPVPPPNVTPAAVDPEVSVLSRVTYRGLAGLQKRNPRVKQKWIWIRLCDLTELRGEHLSRGINGICVFKTGRRETWSGCCKYLIAYFSLQGVISGSGWRRPPSVYPAHFCIVIGVNKQAAFILIRIECRVEEERERREAPGN